MKKRTLSRLLAWALALCLVSGLLPNSVLAAELQNVDTLSNENLQVLVDKRSGGFSIRTLEGDAIRKDDNNKNLLFPLGEDDTSFASLRVTRNGVTKDYVFGGKYAGSSDVAVTATSQEIKAVWSVDGITVTQTLSLANAGSTQHGMAYLSYTAQNSGEAADIQLRLLMDTALGTQDYGIYEVSQSGGGYLTVESEQSISSYQSSFFAYDDPYNPSVFAYFLNGSVGDIASVPAKVTFAHWNNLAATVFDYTPDESLYFTTPYNRDYLTADSAFALYYNLGTVAEGGSAAAAGYYGVFSNAGVAETAGATLNFTNVPEALEMDSGGEAYKDNGDFTVNATLQNISGEALDNVRVVVYPGENIAPYNQSGVLQENVSYLTPYYVDLTNLQADGSQSLEFKFHAVPGEDAVYRKLTFQAYKLEDGSTTLQAQNLLCAQTVWLLCPGTSGKLPEIGFTSASPDLIYTTGTRHIYLTGVNFNMLSGGGYTLLLSRTDGAQINGESSIAIDSSAFIINEEDNTADVVITSELAVGEYQLTIHYTDTTKADITAPALRFQVTDDPEYRNDGYGVVTVEVDSEEQYSVHTYATEESYEKENKSLGDDVLLEFRGAFSQKTEGSGTVYTAVSLGKEDNVITLNNCLDIRDGQVTITDKDGTIEVDFDASLTVSGVGTSVWTGRCCLTAIEDGEEYSLTTYGASGDRDEDGNITLLWPSVGQAAQSLLGLLFEFKYGELGYMEDVGGVIGFGGGLDLSFLIPAAKQAEPEASALDLAKQDLIERGADTPDNLRELEEQIPHDADTVNTNAPPFETSTDMGDGAEAGDGDSRSATIQVDDILFGGGKYLGVNFSVALGLPSYVDGMPGIEGVLTVKTVGDWAVDVSGAASFATFAMEAELAVQSKDGIPYPDTLHFFVGGFVPGINLDGFGVLWLQGAGGGINNLYDTIFLTDSIPPLQLVLEAQFSVLQIISARATLALSLQGISAELSNGTLANSIAVLDSASLEFDWYPEFFFLASVDMNIYGVLQGGGYLVLEEGGPYEFFIRATLSLPGTLPLIGGLTLANVGMGANAEKIWGAAETLGLKVGITYYWGDGVSWNGEDATPSYPELLGLTTVPVYTSPSTGRTLYAAVGSNALVAAQSQLVSGLPAARAEEDSLKSDVTGQNHQLTLKSNTSAAALTFTWDSASEEEAIKEGQKQTTIKNSSDENYTLTWLDPEKDTGAQEDANAYVYYDKDNKQAHMTVTFPADTEGTYTITTPKPATLTLYRLAPLPELTSVTVNGSEAAVTGTDLKQFSEITLLAVDESNPDNSRMVGHVTSSADGPFDSGSVTVLMDTAALPSGSYTLRAVAVDSDSTMFSTAEASWTYTNSNQPDAPTVSGVQPAGDYKVSFTADSTDAEGYRVNFYDAEKNLVSGVSGLKLEPDSSNTYTAGGQATVPEYQTDEDGQLVLDNEGNLISTGNTVTVGLEAGKTYTMGVSAYRTVNDVTLYSEETIIASVQVSAPNPPTFSWNADAEGTTVSTEAGEETFSTLTYRTNALTVTLTEKKGQTVSGAWSLDGGAEQAVESQSAIQMELKDLTEGSHTIRFQGTNSQGDVFLYTQSFSVDTTPPALLVSSPISGSFFGSGGSVTLTGWTDGTLSLLVDGKAESITVTDGSFSQSLALDDSAASHTLTLTATDAAGNTTTRTIQVVNPALGQMTGIAIYANGRDITEQTFQPTGAATLSAVAVLENGKTLSLEGSRLVTWMANPATGTCAVDDNGLLTLSNDAKGVVQACMALTDDQVCTAFAAVDGSMVSPTVTCTAGAGGTLSVTATLNGSNAVESSADGVYTIKKGATVTITPTPSSGYELSALQVDGVTVTLTNGSYTISNLRSAIQVSAVFQPVTEEPDEPDDPGTSGNPGTSGGGSTPTYAVTIPSNTANGSVSVSPKNAAQGTLVTITVSPDDGYVLDQLTVTDAAGGTVPLSQKSENQYTFTMPSGKVSVAASFVQESDVTGLPFTDVKESDWFYQAVRFAVESGMMNGTGGSSFQPGINLSRSMIATILWRLEGSPDGNPTRFTDVPNGQWYTEAVNWAAANDLVNGYGNSTFGPEDDITREQMAAILYRYAQFKGYDCTVQGDLSRFADGGQTSDWARDAVVWAVDKGLLTGKGGGLLDPKGTATRAEVATILMRFVENISQ
ncbi:S-layer homology domain-containing protein [Intestinimonas massiliensis (ex Afouda et al. 2020)]|uniref:S-layer homology domain-containing protein n=1 Tax=Intestinimonas massiliensis (ex Afouda et al. 2020) TaxID=1673721 RepID=UPI00103164BC|nr:S-layer homology domain-containing protein [Intestinimonas massiliensis (ex Afouda et al. 2020)]